MTSVAVQAPVTVRRDVPILRAGGDRWDDLMTLIRARLLIATLALPVGVLLRPDASESAWWVLWWSLLAVGAVSALFWVGVRIRRGVGVQSYLQVGTDLMLVTAISALTGGRDSQFVLFFALVVITGGLLNRMVGGLTTAATACAAFIALPTIAVWLDATPTASTTAALPPPGMLIAYLTMMGVMSGALGERVRKAREDLDRTARELDRVRVDNDVILRHLATGVLTVEARGTVAYLNPAAEQVLAVRSIDSRGLPIEGALPERLHPLRDLILETLRQRSPRSRAELLMKTAAGRGLPLGISTNVLMHEGKLTGVVAVFQDLSEVREMERRARRNETLAELGALSARIAHELRNGLSPISGSVECLQRELKLDGENAVLMDLIATECVRLNRFVSDLLNYSRDRDLACEILDVEEHLGESCDLVKRDPRCTPGITVRLERRGRGAAMRADREQIRQVWLNLAVNALEAMKDGGELRVRCRDGEEEQLVIEFIDTGAGIPAEALSRIGQPFFTTKEKGTGLGVAIAQRIVERHGGTLTFESIPGRGTIARVTLPGVAAAAAALVA
jgi:two-component system sensor histidine kinase PilS (NtrC family)